ncbi:Hypothetical protein R9X50_00570000 [Acrodontium crateriforme]|uniref:Large ribosomal subunit protein mL50 n=1 Tax=Acrodontium crateriforme TaxID=150365 RepID=A0AAQ3M6N9_9PEZI|nr:Hypothetical protein R9X50_00570000 [Acrodontium crateriforme]
MRTARTAERALRLVVDGPRAQYVCQSCRLHAARQFSTTSRHAVEMPWLKQMQQNLFGSKESRESDKIREEKQQKKIADDNKEGISTAPYETTVKGDQVYRVARLIDPSSNKDYIPAENWNRLERVGSEAWVKKRADKGEKYTGFLPRKPVELDNAQWQLLLKNVVVEVLTLAKNHRDVGQVVYRTHPGQLSVKHSQDVKIKLDQDGEAATVEFFGKLTEESILSHLSRELPEDLASTNGRKLALLENLRRGVAEEPAETAETMEWMNLRLENAEAKFYIVKRILQITGKRLSDPVVSRATTVEDLYNAYRAPIVPKKLHQQPQIKEVKVSIPNVKVHKKKQTTMHQEQEIGRWKIIEQELEKRRLPVKGPKLRGARVCL